LELFRLVGSILVNSDEAQENIRSTDQDANQLGETFTGLSGITDKLGGVMLGLSAACMAAAAVVGVKAVSSADELRKSFNLLQTQTGATDTEMSGLKENLVNLYNQNFGESFEDLARSMATVEQNSKRLGISSPNDIENITKKALILRDTFDMEVTESTRAAGSMVQAFGITADEAFDLIAKGAQDGLNVSDDLIDTLNEYAPQFKSLGFSAEEMFLVLKNGAENGAFTVDKAADAIKEFNIRAKDGSKASAEAFTSLGLNAKELTSDFAKGGEAGKEAFFKVVDALNKVKDPVELNTLGVQLFGTQFEDLEAKGLKALVDIKGKSFEAKGTLEEINSIRYNSFGEALTGIGRQLETNLLIPIGEKILPILNDFSNWFQKNIGNITSFVNSFATLKNVVNIFIALTTVTLAYLAATKSLLIIQTIQKAYAAFNVALTAYRAGTLGATIAQWALNAAMIANPVGLIIAAVIVLIGVIVLLVLNFDVIKKWFIDSPGWVKVLIGAFALLSPITMIIAGIALAIEGVKHALSPAIEKTDIFGEGVSKATKKALGGFMNLSDNAEKQLMKLELSGTTITKKMADDMIKTYSDMNKQIIDGMKKKQQQELKTLQDTLGKSKALSQKEKNQILADTKEKNNQEIESQKKKEAQIKKILETASKEKRALTKSEASEIGKIQDSMKEKAVRTFSKSELEQRTIMENIKNNASENTAVMAAEIVKNSKKAKDGAVKEAEKQYNDTVKNIIKMRDETGSISEEQAKKLIDEAKKTKDGTIKEADEMHDKIVKSAKKKAKDHVSEVDWETGEVKSKWSVFWADVGEGTKNLWKTVSKWFSNMWKDVTKAVSGLYKDVINYFTKSWAAAKDGANNIKNAVVNKFNELKNSASNAIESVKNAIVNKFNIIKSRALEIFGSLKIEAGNKLASIKDKSSISFSSDAGNSLFNHISSDAQIIP
jgi:TP901 family phage tail tape measure protein